MKKYEYLNKIYTRAFNQGFRIPEESDRLPRRFKKAVLGTKINKNKLDRLIKSRKISDNICPRCGGKRFWATDNLASYPEQWYRIYCSSCNLRVSAEDNGQYGNIWQEINMGRIKSIKEIEDIDL